jgi:hypothetical protein
VKTLDRVFQYYWWPGMAVDVAEHVQTCEECQRHNSRKGFKNTPMTPLPAPTTIMERIHADLHGPLKTSFESPASGAGSSNKKHTTKQYILMITDSYSK